VALIFETLELNSPREEEQWNLPKPTLLPLQLWQVVDREV
jgi:hypothetical protein